MLLVVILFRECTGTRIKFAAREIVLGKRSELFKFSVNVFFYFFLKLFRIS